MSTTTTAGATTSDDEESRHLNGASASAGSRSAKLFGTGTKWRGDEDQPKRRSKGAVAALKADASASGAVFAHEDDEEDFIYSSREGLFSSLLDENRDRLRNISESYYQLMALLTYKPLIQAFFPTSVFISIMVALGAFLWDQVGSPSLLTLTILANILPILHARLLTNNFLGQGDLIGNPFINCLRQEREDKPETGRCCKKSSKSSGNNSTVLPKPSKLELASSDNRLVQASDDGYSHTTHRNSIFTKQTFAPGKGLQEASLYRVLSSIISFNIRIQESQRWDEKAGCFAPLVPTELWEQVEAKTNMGFFLLSTQLAYFFFAVPLVVLFIVWIIQGSIVPLVSNGPVSALSAVWHVYNWASFFFWLYGCALIGGVWAVFLLTMHCHHFQMTLFKARLEFDRLHNEDQIPQWKTLRLFIEEYLFHQQTIKRTSEAWGLIVVVCLLALFLYCVAALASFILDHNVNLLLLGMVSSILFLQALYFIAALNGELSALRETLVLGSSQDWKRYGGREELLKYLDSNQTQFTVFGLAITFKFLVGITTTIITANFSAIIAVLGVKNAGGTASTSKSGTN